MDAVGRSRTAAFSPQARPPLRTGWTRPPSGAGSASDVTSVLDPQSEEELSFVHGTWGPRTKAEIQERHWDPIPALTVVWGVDRFAEQRGRRGGRLPRWLEVPAVAEILEPSHELTVHTLGTEQAPVPEQVAAQLP